MHPEIENLINMALADGNVTEKERGIILRKAEALGLDKDEVEMILDGKLALIKNQNSKQSSSTTSKIGEVKKCPSCGAVAAAFSSSCSECNFEFRNVGANTSVKLLVEKLEKIVAECNKMSFEETNPINRLTDTQELKQGRREAEISARQREVIKNFPIPNTREDILEMLHFILPRTKPGFSADKNYSAWLTKFQEVLSRAKVAFANDSRMMAEIASFEQQQKSSTIMSIISKFNELPKKTKSSVIIVLVAGVLFFGLGRNSMGGGGYREKHEEEVEKEKAKLELIVSKVNEAIGEKKYDEAEVLARQLVWGYSDGYSKSDTDQLIKSWDEKRAGMLTTIENLKSEK